MTCKSLYVLCLEFCIPRFENYSREKGNGSCKRVGDLAAPIIEDMLNHAFFLVNGENKSRYKIWKTEWKIFFTPKITSAVLSWDSDLISHVGATCHNLTKCEVVLAKGKMFDAGLVAKLPKSVTTLDFDGELINRGKQTKPLLFEGEDRESWLPHAEQILKALHILRIPQPQHPSTPNNTSLVEVNLGTTQATSSDLKLIISNCPNLRLLRHYQMLTALYELHSETWRKKGNLPRYKLRNLDVDFSHVVRCRMSPEWVLSPDALRLGVVLCPSASSIRVRFDCSTPHDVLAPLLALSKVKEFSAVCVSSGERTLLDFGDLAPILEKFGPVSLTFVELKVIEEVEIHLLIEYCTKTETLVLSGCGYVTPSTCSTFACQTYERGSLHRLRALFYADGDDFSWDHGVPECFWRASLCPGKNRAPRLQGLFLEYPRMTPSLINEVFHSGPVKPPFPELEALSLCRFDEVTVDDVAAVCGLPLKGRATPSGNLKYIRLSECEGVKEAGERRLRAWLKHNNMNKVKLVVGR